MSSKHITDPKRKRATTKQSAPANTEPVVFAKNAHPDIKEHMNMFGYAVVQVLSAEECNRAIVDQVKNILMKQPWMEKLKVQDRATGDSLDIDINTKQYVQELTTPGIPAEALVHYDSVWPLHKGFGACCDPLAFHLGTMYDVRQDGDLYEVACSVIGKKELFFTLDRCIHKLPGKGDPEFLHWDLNIFKTDPREGQTHDSAMCGKVMFTESTFICVPGTHTLEFAKEFKDIYSPIYRNINPSAAKFGLDPKKDDPMNLRDMRQAITIPAGCAIFWSPYLLHGTQKSMIDQGIEFGMYLGYMTDIDRPNYKDGNERQDRINSYLLGKAPVMYPSLDPTHYYPARYDNFPHMLDPYVEKTAPDYEGRSERMVKSGLMRGIYVRTLKPVLDSAYVPFGLSPLGERMLGLSAWDV